MQRSVFFATSVILAGALLGCGSPPLDSIDAGAEPSDPATIESDASRSDEFVGGDAGSAPVEPSPVLVPCATETITSSDVSVLYPLPKGDESRDFIRPSEYGTSGVLLPSGLKAELRDPTPVEVDVVDDEAYDGLALVAFRLDPCSGRGQVETCPHEIRAIYQHVYELGDRVYAGDTAYHVFYKLTYDELQDTMREILALNAACHAVRDCGPLGVHPTLNKEGLGGPFAKGLRKILLAHLGASRIQRITRLQVAGVEGPLWSFQIFEKGGSSFVASQIPFTKTFSQTVSANESAASMDPSTSVDQVGPAVAFDRSSHLTAIAPAFQSAIRVQNPNVHYSESIDCANCHLAEAAQRIGASEYGLVPNEPFKSSRNLAYRRDELSVENLHAFSYRGRAVSVMARTANESAMVAETMQKWFESTSY